MGTANRSVESITVPIIPNRPLKSAGEAESFGRIALRRNAANGLIDNAEFDGALIQYDADYQNNQAVSSSFTDHMRDVQNILKARYSSGAKVVEVGCGKGEFLEMLQADGHFEISGYDGAYDGGNPAIEKRFLTEADELHADVVVLRHVLEHVQRPHEFLSLLSSIFAEADIYIEVPDFDWIETHQTFFDITYEHVNYFTPPSLSRLFKSVERQGLLFGEQYQFVIGKFSAADFTTYGRAFDEPENWTSLKFDGLFPTLMSVIENLNSVSKGRPVFIWGAATKGVMFCHHVRRLLPAVFERIVAAVDINPMKAGNFMPSVRLPILSVDDFREQAQNDALVVIMNPNYRDEIVASLRAWDLHEVQCVSM